MGDHVPAFAERLARRVSGGGLFDPTRAAHGVGLTTNGDRKSFLRRRIWNFPTEGEVDGS